MPKSDFRPKFLTHRQKVNNKSYQISKPRCENNEKLGSNSSIAQPNKKLTSLAELRIPMSHSSKRETLRLLGLKNRWADRKNTDVLECYYLDTETREYLKILGRPSTPESEIDVAPWINLASWKFDKKNKHSPLKCANLCSKIQVF